MRIKKVTLFFVAILLPSWASSYIGPSYVAGRITNITSVNHSILIKVESGEVSQNCTNNSSGWMQISEDKKPIVALTLTAWTIGRTVTVYTDPSSTGYCQVNQVDPAES